jgi:hypothetical protein
MFYVYSKRYYCNTLFLFLSNAYPSIAHFDILHIFQRQHRVITIKERKQIEAV